MENQMDKLFKDKLESHSLPPSEEAWTKVEAKLSKKNNVIAWRIAAAVLLMGAFLSLFYWSQKSEKTVQLIIAVKPSQKENKLAQAAQGNSSKKDEPLQTEVKGKEKTSNKVVGKKESSSLVAEQPTQKEENIKTQSIIEERKENAVAVVNETKPEEKLITQATSANKVASTTQKPIKLEFTLDNITSEEKIVATNNEVKNSGLKKVWELAREVKNGEGPIREIKNELFALNFKKNKNQ